MLRRPHYFALAMVVLLTVTILNLPGKTSSRLKLGIGSFFLPLFGLAGSSQQVVGQIADSLLPRKEIIRQRDRLSQENEELRFRLARAETMERENARLRQLLGWKQQRNWKVKLGTVVLREPANWWRTVQIDLGSRDGLTSNLPVLGPDGYLVGRTGAVGLNRCQVVLLGDPNCKVAARVENETRDTGVIGTAGPLDGELVEMGYLSRSALLKPGQDVVTSGLGGIFPKDIPVGKVVDSRSVDFGFQTLARIRLGANLSALEQVWVLLEK